MPRRLPLVALLLSGVLLIVGAIVVGLDPVTRGIDGWRFRPRVLAGGDRFDTVTVTDRASSRLTGEFDGEPGADLAIVEYDTIRLLTPATLLEHGRLELDGEPRSQWKPSFRLARLGGALVVVDTGGGLDDAVVRNLDGAERWRYRFDEALPATSLEPADLDGDGDAEFYATTTGHAARLGGDGREVWRAPFSGGRIVATAPRTRRDPAWIVAEGQGETVVWDSDGTPLASLRMKDARPLATIDWPDGRYLLAGGPALRAIALDGRVVFEWRVPDVLVSAARPLSLEAAAPHHVALVASGPGERDRWRLQIVSRDSALVYDERLDTPLELLTARGADGTDRLFLDRASLLALRTRAP